MILIDKNEINIRGTGADVLIELTLIMHSLLDLGCEPQDLHAAADLATMAEEEIQKADDRLRGIHQMVSDAFDAARKD